MPENIVFYVVFISQIILISYHYPSMMKNRMQTVLEKYPASEYPKLYPVSMAQNNKGRKLFSFINQSILFIGVIAVFVIGYWDFNSEGEINQMMPFGYFVLQMVPFALMEFSGFAYFKLMRKADKRTTKKADMTPRRLVSFISPKILLLAAISNLLCLLFFFYLDHFEFRIDGDLLPIFLALFFSNGVYAIIIYINIKGKKFNPHQSAEDRYKQIEVVVKSLIYTSIGASLFLIMIKVVDEFQLHYLEAAIMSLYLQFIVMIGLGSILNKLKIENINFDVYRNESTKLVKQGE